METTSDETFSVCPYRSLTTPTVVHHAPTQRTDKEEDVLFVHEENGYRLFGVSDGHQGVNCAAFIEQHFWSTLRPLLPVLSPEGSDDETFHIREKILKAMVEAFRLVDSNWYNERMYSGATLTVALLTGRLLTVANVGDSVAYLHDGKHFFPITKSHRLDDNLHEKQRLERAGVTIAPLCSTLNGPAQPGKMGYGPFRVWPGGLAVSRSIGDADVSSHVWCVPHLHQILLPTAGARLILASDGLWDCLSIKSVKRMVKKKSIYKCAGELVELVGRAQGGQLSDDVTIIVVDVLEAEGETVYRDFKYVLQNAEKQKQSNVHARVGNFFKSGSKRFSKSSKNQAPDDFLAAMDGVTFVSEHLMERNIESLVSSNDTPAFPIHRDYTVSDKRRAHGMWEGGTVDHTEHLLTTTCRASRLSLFAVPLT